MQISVENSIPATQWTQMQEAAFQPRYWDPSSLFALRILGIAVCGTVAFLGARKILALDVSQPKDEHLFLSYELYPQPKKGHPNAGKFAVFGGCCMACLLIYNVALDYFNDPLNFADNLTVVTETFVKRNVTVVAEKNVTTVAEYASKWIYGLKHCYANMSQTDDAFKAFVNNNFTSRAIKAVAEKTGDVNTSFVVLDKVINASGLNGTGEISVFQVNDISSNFNFSELLSNFTQSLQHYTSNIPSVNYTRLLENSKWVVVSTFSTLSSNYFSVTEYVQKYLCEAYELGC